MRNNVSSDLSSITNDVTNFQQVINEYSIDSVKAIWGVYRAINALKGMISLLTQAFKETLAYASDAEKMSKSVVHSNMTANKFQALANAAKKYGGSALETAKSVETLRKGLADIQKGGDGNGLKETLKAFNINPAGLQSADQFLEVIAGRMETLKSDTEKLDFGHALGLDDSTIQVLSGGIKKYKQELADASKYQTLSGKDLERAKELEENLVLIGMGIDTFFSDIYKLLLPIVLFVAKCVRKLVDMFTHVGVVIVGVLGGILAFILGVPGVIVTAIGIVISLLLSFWKWVEEQPAIWGNFLKDFDTIKTGLSDGFQQIGENIVNSITAVWNFLTEFFTNIIDFVKTIVSNVVSAFGQVAQQVAHVFMGVLNAIRSAFGKVIGFVQDVVSKVLEIIPDWLKNFLMRGTVVGVVANGIVKGAKALHKNATAANGIGYVPFDGYLAELHQGESVLDKSEANIWRDLQAGKDAISTTANVPLASVPQGAITNAYQSSDVNKSFTIGDITIQTAATDADGIANDLMDSIKKAFNGLDSGVRA